MIDTGIRMIIAGGKTGGHLFPGIAVAQAVRVMEPGAVILFVGTGGAFETRTLDRYGFDHTAITVSGIKGLSIIRRLSALMKLPMAAVQAIGILRRFSPSLVLGVGGYSSGPVVLAAKMLGIPTALQEQNSIPGITNRILARVVDRIFTGFERTQGFENLDTVVNTGNPVRRQASLTEEKKCENNPFTLLVTGGSQGAVSLNRAVVAALGDADLPAGFRVVHQTGAVDEADIRAAYEGLGIQAEVRAFFDDLPLWQTRADLVVCRAGAGTLAELTELGRPMILVPYPFAADDHQRYNAQSLVDKGAARMVLDKDLGTGELAVIIKELLVDPDELERMAGASAACAKLDADRVIARQCLDMARKKE